ncbi:MAG: hypothetical protein EOP64_00335 [Sphingomonas sp.]|nr:MAG: hypothetical protein EOP64_00335 [Sphingomonas sp.]
MDISLELDPASPRYLNTRVIDGDLVLTSDADPRGTHYILQAIVVRLRMQRGAWFLNTQIGVPYREQVFVKNPDRASIENTLKATILGTPGVLSITRFDSTFTSANRLLRIYFEAQTLAGNVSFGGPLNTPTAELSQ